MIADLARTIGAGMRAARKSLQLTQADAAERIGIGTEYYGRLERGTHLPSIETFVAICCSFGVSADSMLGRDGADAPSYESALASVPTDPPELRPLFRRLRGARPATLRVVKAVLAAMERPE